MTGDNSLIGELKARRQQLGFELADLAQRSRIDTEWLRAWERGEGFPSLDAAQRWAEALDLRLSLAASRAEGQRAIRIDWDRRRVTVSGAPVRLTPMEWRVIERLARTPGALVSHQELYRYVYGEEWPSRGQATAVRVLITKLRRLLPLQIEARWGQGYTLTGIEPAQTVRGGAEPEEPAGEVAAKPPFPNGLDTAPKTIPRPSPVMRPSPLRTGDVVARRGVAPEARPNTGRAEELGVIERFLAERGVTRCPDLRTIEKSPLPALVWDKTKRKWVRPAAQELRTG
jgi:transcriptional regulator with XRE-family HTH domain